MIERKTKRTARVGLFGVAHGVYWEQFPGLLESLMRMHEQMKAKLYVKESAAIISVLDNLKISYEIDEKPKLLS